MTHAPHPETMSKSFRPILTNYNLLKTPPRGASLRLFAPICTQLRLFTPFLDEKKIVYFFAGPSLALDASAQINPNQPSNAKYKPNTDQIRPKTSDASERVQPFNP